MNMWFFVAPNLEVYIFFTSNVTVSSNLRITQNLEGKISLEWKWQNGFEKCSWRPQKNVDKDVMDWEKKGLTNNQAFMVEPISEGHAE